MNNDHANATYIAIEALSMEVERLSGEWLNALSYNMLLFRPFPAFSDPAPYSHEQEEAWDEPIKTHVWGPHYVIAWRSCAQCCYLERWVHGPYKCKLYRIDETCSSSKDYCLFTQYRHILFRKFDMEGL